MGGIKHPGPDNKGRARTKIRVVLVSCLLVVILLDQIHAIARISRAIDWDRNLRSNALLYQPADSESDDGMEEWQHQEKDNVVILSRSTHAIAMMYFKFQINC